MNGSSAGHSHRFLVELWLEPRELPGAPLLMRGRVRDVRSERQVYVKSFAEIEAFIDAVLEAAGETPRGWDAAP